MAIDQGKLVSAQNHLQRFSQPATAVLELIQSLGEVGSLIGAAREAEERRARLQAECAEIVAQVDAAKGELQRMSSHHMQTQRELADMREKLDALLREHDGLAPKVDEARGIAATLEDRRRQLGEIEAHLTAGRLRFAS